MDIATFKHFKYEIALGAEIPMPKPTIDFFSQQQYTVQQYLHTLCKVNVGALGKKDGKWAFGEDFNPPEQPSKRQDIVEIFDFAEKMGIIEPKPSEGGSDSPGEGVFIPYQLSKVYWDKFDKFAS